MARSLILQWNQRNALIHQLIYFHWYNQWRFHWFRFRECRLIFVGRKNVWLSALIHIFGRLIHYFHELNTGSQPKISIHFFKHRCMLEILFLLAKQPFNSVSQTFVHLSCIGRRSIFVWSNGNISWREGEKGGGGGGRHRKKNKCAWSRNVGNCHYTCVRFVKNW